MGDLLIRNVPDEVLEALSQLAQASGAPDRMSYVREKIVEIASQPLVQARYVLKAYGPGQALAQIRRESDSIGGGSHDLSPEQMNAYRLAKDLVQRNNPGDREAALKLLGEHFGKVFETLM